MSAEEKKQKSHRKEKPKPATSVHLTYKLPPIDKSCAKVIKFHNNVTVSQSYECTYFAVIQFGGGYCGIQQRDFGPNQDEEDKIAIFSVWNEQEHNVELVEAGDDVTVEPFGGEGTGLKSTRPLPWQMREPVGFTVTTRIADANSYEMRCDVSFRNQSIHMATFRRRHGSPMSHFVCFVEDYRRRSGCQGMMHPRCGHFHGAYCQVDGGEPQRLNETKFSKVTNGHDVHGNDRCTAGVEKNAFFLRTGGQCQDRACCHGDVFCLLDDNDKKLCCVKPALTE